VTTRKKARALADAYDVVVVGAGPVGLWCAINIKLLTPTTRVLVVDKYSVYHRHHVLRIEPDSMAGPIALRHNPRLAAFRKGIPQIIRTSDLEARLAAFAMEVGVAVQVWKVESLPALLSSLPSVRLLVGADGRNSLTRQWLLGRNGDVANESVGIETSAASSSTPSAGVYSTSELTDPAAQYAVKDTLSMCVQLKYEVEGSGKRLRKDQAYAVLKAMHFPADEHFGKERDGVTAVTVQIVLNTGRDDAVFATMVRFYPPPKIRRS
jgi:hypothetical protein